MYLFISYDSKKHPLIFKTDATGLICNECLYVAYVVVTEYLWFV